MGDISDVKKKMAWLKEAFNKEDKNKVEKINSVSPSTGKFSQTWSPNKIDCEKSGAKISATTNEPENSEKEKFNLISNRKKWLEVNKGEEKKEDLKEGEMSLVSNRMKSFQLSSPRSPTKLSEKKNNAIIKDRMKWIEGANVQEGKKTRVWRPKKSKEQLEEENRKDLEKKKTKARKILRKTSGLISERMQWVSDLGKEENNEKHSPTNSGKVWRPKKIDQENSDKKDLAIGGEEAKKVNGGYIAFPEKLIKIVSNQSTSPHSKEPTMDLVNDRMNWLQGRSSDKQPSIISRKDQFFSNKLMTDKTNDFISNSTKSSPEQSSDKKPSASFKKEQMASNLPTSERKKSDLISDRKKWLADQSRRQLSLSPDKGGIASNSSSTKKQTNALISDRMKWLQDQTGKQIISHGPIGQGHEIRSPSALVEERMKWLKEQNDKSNKSLKKKIEVTNNLVSGRKIWLVEKGEKAAKPPEKVEVVVTKTLIANRMSWLADENEKASKSPMKKEPNVSRNLIDSTKWLEMKHHQQEEVEKRHLVMPARVS